jgi:hypothetical protein
MQYCINIGAKSPWPVKGTKYVINDWFFYESATSFFNTQKFKFLAEHYGVLG